MGVNQAIYTSSARGIKKGGGLGIHTYNEECSERELSEFVQSFCLYPYGGRFEDIHLLPTKMLYKKIADDRYMQAEVTYLGLDYDKISGRTGNILSHMISYRAEETGLYPMELYGSRVFMRSVDPKDVDGSTETEYLPVLEELSSGDDVTIEKIQDFLSDEKKMEFFCHLLAGVISCGTGPKIIICDSHENIVRWIAAIEYALPLSCARDISFSTLEDNPLFSEFDIRGAVPGLSKGMEEYSDRSGVLVYDGINGVYPEFDIEADYYQYGIRMGLAFSYESLRKFHTFVKEYEYTKLSPDLYDGFLLFQMQQNGTGILEEDEIERAVSFQIRYGNPDTGQKVLQMLIENIRTSDMNGGAAAAAACDLLSCLLHTMSDNPDYRRIVNVAASLEAIGKTDLETVRKQKRIWEDLYQYFYTEHRTQEGDFVRLLCENECHARLGEYCVWIFRNSREEDADLLLKNLLDTYWNDVPLQKWNYFAPVISAFTDRLENKKDTELAEKAFLMLQKTGKGEISGKGMENLIAYISDNISLTNEKRFASLRARRRNSDIQEKRRLEQCAQEVFQYVQKYNVNLPIVKIRLQHIKQCMEDAYEGGTPLETSRELYYYCMNPVRATETDKRELEKYLEQICHIFGGWNHMEQDYICLLRLWRLDRDGKKFIIRKLLSQETEKVLRDGKTKGLATLLEAVESTWDDEYAEALDSVVSEMKTSLRERITKALDSAPDTKGGRNWKRLNRQDI